MIDINALVHLNFTFTGTFQQLLLCLMFKLIDDLAKSRLISQSRSRPIDWIWGFFKFFRNVSPTV